MVSVAERRAERRVPQSLTCGVQPISSKLLCSQFTHLLLLQENSSPGKYMVCIFTVLFSPVQNVSAPEDTVSSLMLDIYLYHVLTACYFKETRFWQKLEDKHSVRVSLLCLLNRAH